MTEKKNLLNIVSKWNPEFLLGKLNEIISKPPVRDMLKNRIPEDLLRQIDECSVVLRNSHILHGIFDNIEKVKLAKHLLTNNKKQIERFSHDLYTDVMDEIKEIGEELKWSKSKQGTLVLAIEDWQRLQQLALPRRVHNLMFLRNHYSLSIIKSATHGESHFFAFETDLQRTHKRKRCK